MRLSAPNFRSNFRPWGARRYLLTGVAAAAAMSSIVITGPVSASSSAKTPSHCTTANGIKVRDPLVCKGLAFYRGQTLTDFDISSVGSAFYDETVAVQPLVAAYLGATVNVPIYSIGNTIPGQDAMASSVPNGLSFGILNVLNDASLILTNTPGINFNPARLAFLSGTQVNSTPFITQPSTSFKSFADVLAANKAGSLKVLTETTGTINTYLRVWFGVEGIKPQWVTGYSSLSQYTAGFVRGDGPLADISLSSSCPLLIGGQAVALATNTVPPVGTNCRKYLAAVPTLKDLYKEYPPTTKAQRNLWQILFALNNDQGYPFATQTGVPAYKVDTLRAALKWAYAQPSFRSQMLANGLNPNYVDPVIAKNNFRALISNGAKITCYIEATCS